MISGKIVQALTLLVAMAAVMLVSLVPKTVTAAGTFTVSNTDDSGLGSLRQAITDANTAAGGTITFTAGVTGTIDLQAALPNLDSDIIIDGPGASTLTVQRSFAVSTPAFSVFTINVGKTVEINGLTIKNGNGGLDGGGGVYNGGTLFIIACAISNNNSLNSHGGGINNAGTLIITDSTVANNSTPMFGGGIFNNINSATLTNCTIANNSSGVGGGIMNFIGVLNVYNSTVANNIATQLGGGGINSAGALFLRSTIVAKNTGQFPDVGLISNSLGHNLIGNSTGSIGGDPSLGDLFNIDPLFEQGLDGKPLLKDNGGPTPTIALRCGSPAIDKGKNEVFGLTTDQRGAGFLRTVNDPAIPDAVGGGDGTDIGAFEVQSVGQSCFDLCLQDDGGSASLQINSQSGDYRFCCGGQTYVGKGTVTIKGAMVTLQDYSGNRRVLAKVDKAVNRAVASLQVQGGSLCTISDRNLTNNTCSCASPAAPL